MRVRVIALAFLSIRPALPAAPGLGIEVCETFVSSPSAGLIWPGSCRLRIPSKSWDQVLWQAGPSGARKPSQQLPTLEDERSLLPFEDQFFDVELQPSRLGTVYCVKVVGVLFRSHQCPISRVFVASLR